MPLSCLSPQLLDFQGSITPLDSQMTITRRVVDCQAAGREVVSWLSDWSVSHRLFKVFSCVLMCFMCYILSSRVLFVYNLNGLTLMDGSEVNSDEQSQIFVKGQWIKWPPCVVLLGKNINSWENTRDLHGLRHITWDLKNLLHSSNLDGIDLKK